MNVLLAISFSSFPFRFLPEFYVSVHLFFQAPKNLSINFGNLMRSLLSAFPLFIPAGHILFVVAWFNFFRNSYDIFSNFIFFQNFCLSMIKNFIQFCRPVSIHFNISLNLFLPPQKIFTIKNFGAKNNSFPSSSPKKPP